MPRPVQTTFTFKNEANAKRFASWLRTNRNDRDYGYPELIDTRPVGQAEWCVEYRAESDMARGVATGIDLA